MKRSRIKPTNPERRAGKRERNYTAGSGKDTWIRSLPCLVPGCRRPSVAAHAIARGMGGVKGSAEHLVPLCYLHHIEAGERRTTQRLGFEAQHGLTRGGDDGLVVIAAELHALWIDGADGGAPF